MSLIAEHMFSPEAIERRRRDLEEITRKGVLELKALLKRQHEALRLKHPPQKGDDHG